MTASLILALALPSIAAHSGVSAWIASSMKRLYPASPSESAGPFPMEMARGERSAFQFAVRTGSNGADVALKVEAPHGVRASVRRVGYVPLRAFNTDTPEDERDGNGYVPGLVPDPLYPESKMVLQPNETASFWVTVDVADDAKPGQAAVTAIATIDGQASVERNVDVEVHKARVAPRRGFPITQWFYADALCDFYRVKPFEDRFWKIVETYVRDVVDHGQNMLYVPMFTPSTDGVKRPTQLLGIQRHGEKYEFDWSRVKRWVDMAKRLGIRYFEWSHMFSQWGCKHAVRVYEGDIADERLLWDPETPATAPVYRNFLKQLLPQLHDFVVNEGIESTSYFHISDEPDGAAALANYRAAREMVREIAPWMKVMDAISEVAFARERLIDVPVPTISSAPDFQKAGFAAWAYFCCGPRGRYLNRLMDTPLAKIRMSGWLLYRLRAQGFLHWGYNYWYKSQTRTLIDPFKEQSGDAWPGWAFGDPFVVYPGPNGPIDSTRWEVFAESMRDYALLQSAGIDPDDPMLGQIHDYADFPKSEAWIQAARREALARLDKLAQR